MYEDEFDFDFDDYEISEEETPDDFNFDLVFGYGNEPEFDDSILDEPVGDYEDDDDEGDDDPSFGVPSGTKGPDDGRGGGTALKNPRTKKEPELVGV